MTVGNPLGQMVYHTASHIDGGTVRLRTPLGHKSEWKNYKAVKIHDRVGMATRRTDATAYPKVSITDTPADIPFRESFRAYLNGDINLSISA